jgi:hypothetical protein
MLFIHTKYVQPCNHNHQLQHIRPSAPTRIELQFGPNATPSCLAMLNRSYWHVQHAGREHLRGQSYPYYWQKKSATRVGPGNVVPEMHIKWCWIYVVAGGRVIKRWKKLYRSSPTLWCPILPYVLSETALFIVRFCLIYCPILPYLLSDSALFIVRFCLIDCLILSYLLSDSALFIVRFCLIYCSILPYLLSGSALSIIRFCLIDCPNSPYLLSDSALCIVRIRLIYCKSDSA